MEQEKINGKMYQPIELTRDEVRRDNGCRTCALVKLKDCLSIGCTADDRNDGKNVYFLEIKD